MHADVVQQILKASGLPDEVIRTISNGTPETVQNGLESTDLEKSVRGDHFGLLSSSSTSLKKRRAFYSCLPFSDDYIDLHQMLPWLERLTTVHYRPLRIAATLAVLHFVERILRSDSPNLNDPSETTKLGFAFCGSVASRMLYPRTRDTCPVIRHGVCDAILKWCDINPEVLTSSVFNNRSGNMIETLGHFIQDEDSDVRELVVSGLSSLVQNETIASRTVQRITNEICQLLLNSILSKAEELNELTETGNPPYIALLHAELNSSIQLVRKIVSRTPSILDVFESAGKNNFDLLFQLSFDPNLPTHIRTSIAQIVSSHILGADIKSRSFRDTRRAIEMLIAFIYQYTPFVGIETEVDYRSVFDAFCSATDSSGLADYINESVEQLVSGEHALKKVRLLVQLVETCAEIVKKNNYKNCPINIVGMFGVLNQFEESSRSIVYFLNAIVLISQTVDVQKLMSAGEIVEAVQEIVPLVDPSNNRPYQQVYLGYSIWSQLATINDDAAIRMKDWASRVDQHLTVETLKNVHALESSTMRDLADLGAMEKLLDYVETGDVPSIAIMCCAIDLVVIQILKKNSAIDEMFRLDRLRKRVQSILQSLSNDAAQSDARDQSARVIQFFCQYRLVLLGEVRVAPKLAREKGNICINSKIVKTIGLRLNEYIIADLLENETVDMKFVELQHSISAEVRE
jgi:hypothetical protein